MTEVSLTDEIVQFAQAQPLFWVASAPLSETGHVNVSPKGFPGTFGFISPEAFSKCCDHTLPALSPFQRASQSTPLASSSQGSSSSAPSEGTVLGYFAYIDIGGSGIETVAHLQENGRITVLFSAFEGPPKLLRLFGRGGVLEPGRPGWHEVVSAFAAKDEFFADATQPKPRNLVIVAVQRSRTSCGFGVPIMELKGSRSIFPDRFQEWTQEQFEARRATANVQSIDNLPGLPRLQSGFSPFLTLPASTETHRIIPVERKSEISTLAATAASPSICFIAGAVTALIVSYSLLQFRLRHSQQ